MIETLRDNLDVLWQVPLAVAVLALFYAVVGLAVASLTDRRIVAGAAIIGLLLVTSITAGVLIGDRLEFEEGSPAALINVLVMPLYLRDVIFFGHIEEGSDLSGVSNGGWYALAAYVAVVLVAVGGLLRRYRWVER